VIAIQTSKITTTDGKIGDPDRRIPFSLPAAICASVECIGAHLIHPETVVQNCNTRRKITLPSMLFSFRKIIDPVNPLCCYSCTRSV
jgi:hypothetical protein